MPLQNRVTPEGDIIAMPERGTMLGNRGGCFHRADRTLGGRRWATKRWICCRLRFKGRRRIVMTPDRYTELFFLDEATALAAGHRPCFECRRDDAMVFAQLWAEARRKHTRAAADDMDRVLHRERLGKGGGKATFRAPLVTLPDATMVRGDGGPLLVRDRRLLAWTPRGYRGAEQQQLSAEMEVLTPSSIVEVLKLGYSPGLHRSASRPR